MLDTHGQPDQPEVITGQNGRKTTEAAPSEGGQAVSLNTAQSGKLLGVDGRQIRRYITEGLANPSGRPLFLTARRITTSRGQEWAIYEHDLIAFKQERDRAATEGQTSEQIQRADEERSQALTLSYQVIAAELESRNKALIEAQATIERLAAEAGRSGALEAQVGMLQDRVNELKAERDQWQVQAREAQEQAQEQARQSSLYRVKINLFPIKDNKSS
jgi:hypothetical protein